jgi:hypothetical protein
VGDYPEASANAGAAVIRFEIRAARRPLDHVRARFPSPLIGPDVPIYAQAYSPLSRSVWCPEILAHVRAKHGNAEQVNSVRRLKLVRSVRHVHMRGSLLPQQENQ